MAQRDLAAAVDGVIADAEVALDARRGCGFHLTDEREGAKTAPRFEEGGCLT